MVDSKLSFIKNILGNCKYSSSTKEAEFHCPKCNHHKNKLSINLEIDIYKCWVCSKTGTLISLLREMNATPFQISEYIKKYKAKNIIIKNQPKDEYFISLPEEYQPLINLRKSIISKKAFDYLSDRNISEEIILKYKLGYCATGDFAHRIIIPSFDRYGNLNFFTGRDISGLSNLPYLNDKNMPKGYKNRIIINDLNINFTKPVILTEGFFDMFNSAENTIPLCGSTLNKDSLLFKTIVENETQLILALDPDAFYEKTLHIAKLMLSYGLDVKSVDFRPHKDLGSMTKEESLQSFHKAKPIDSSFILKNKFKGLFKD